MDPGIPSGSACGGRRPPRGLGEIQFADADDARIGIGEPITSRPIVLLPEPIPDKPSVSPRRISKFTLFTAATSRCELNQALPR